MKKSSVVSLVVILLTIIGQVFALAIMTWQRTDILTHGKHFSFRTMPVDPRDLLRGDYVVLRYSFSSLNNWNDFENLDDIPGAKLLTEENAGRFIYLTLVPETERLPKWRQQEEELQRKIDKLIEQGEDSWEGERTRDQLQRLRARCETASEELWTASSVSFTKPTSGFFIRGRLRSYRQIDYGIEAFYVQEGSGLAIEDAIRNQNDQIVIQDDQIVIADVAINEHGEAALRNVRVVATAFRHSRESGNPEN